MFRIRRARVRAVRGVHRAVCAALSLLSCTRCAACAALHALRLQSCAALWCVRERASVGAGRRVGGGQGGTSDMKNTCLNVQHSYQHICMGAWVHGPAVGCAHPLAHARARDCAHQLSKRGAAARQATNRQHRQDRFIRTSLLRLAAEDGP